MFATVGCIRQDVGGTADQMHCEEDLAGQRRVMDANNNDDISAELALEENQCKEA